MTSSSHSSPGLVTRMRARLAGEIASDTLDAYRAAGAAAYGLLVEAEERRQALPAGDYRTVAGGLEVFFACSWNAYALQMLGDGFVDADYEYEPKTAGFLPPVTAEQALRFYRDVEQWLVRARQSAAAGGDFELDLYVPAELPAWVEVEPCPMPHLHAMLRASANLREHAEIALSDLERRSPGEPDQALRKIRSVLAEATTSAGYAESLHSQLPHGEAASADLHARIEASAQKAIEQAFLVGQLAAMPGLTSSDAVTIATGQRLPGPGEPGFDPWVLTDPDTRASWKRDREAQRAIDNLWRNDPDPRATLEIQSQIDAARTVGAIDNAPGSGTRRLGHYYCCPWSPIYEAQRPVKIGDRRLRPGQQFTFDVSAEEIAEGGEFKRELLLADFSPTDEIDYCNPER